MRWASPAAMMDSACSADTRVSSLMPSMKKPRLGSSRSFRLPRRGSSRSFTTCGGGRSRVMTRLLQVMLHFPEGPGGIPPTCRRQAAKQASMMPQARPSKHPNSRCHRSPTGVRQRTCAGYSTLDNSIAAQNRASVRSNRLARLKLWHRQHIHGQLCLQGMGPVTSCSHVCPQVVLLLPGWTTALPVTPG